MHSGATVLLLLCVGPVVNGIQYELASYRVRRHYELRPDDTGPKTLDRLAELLDLDKHVDLREEDSLMTVQGTRVKRYVEMFDGQRVQGSHIDISVKANGEIDRFGGSVTSGLQEEATGITMSCKMSEMDLISLIIAQKNDFLHDHIIKVRVESSFGQNTGTDVATLMAKVDVLYYDSGSDGGEDEEVTRSIYMVDQCARTVANAVYITSSYKKGKKGKEDKKDNKKEKEGKHEKDDGQKYQPAPVYDPSPVYQDTGSMYQGVGSAYPVTNMGYHGISTGYKAPGFPGEAVPEDNQGEGEEENLSPSQLAKQFAEIGYYEQAKSRARVDKICNNDAHGFGGNMKTGTIPYGKVAGMQTALHCLEPLLRKIKGGVEMCYLTNQYVYVVDLEHGSNEKVSKKVGFPCWRGYDDSLNGAFSPALDAFFFGTQVGKMWREWYRYAPLTSPVPRAFVHYGESLDNAFWDGENVIIGDGVNDTFPYAVLDVIAHELAHGVTERSSSLATTGEAGAIGESFCDMTGEVAEAFVWGWNDWVVGRDILKPGIYKGHIDAIRYFEFPTNDGSSVDHTRDYTKNTDSHHGSGIFNKVFFRVSEYLGIRRAFQPFLIANRLYWTPHVTFEDAACHVVKGAYDTGLDIAVYILAFQEVGIYLELCEWDTKFVLPLVVDETRGDLTVSNETQPMFMVFMGTNQGFIVNTEGGTNTQVEITTTPSRFYTNVLKSGPGWNGVNFSLSEHENGDKEVTTDEETGQKQVYVRLVSTSPKEESCELHIRFI